MQRKTPFPPCYTVARLVYDSASKKVKQNGANKTSLVAHLCQTLQQLSTNYLKKKKKNFKMFKRSLKVFSRVTFSQS